jgi:hypothetical protein
MRTATFRTHRHLNMGRVLVLTGVLVAALTVAASPLAASASTPYGTNLVKNGGAQDGLIAWETFPPDDFQTHAYGPSGIGFPSQGAAQGIQGGTEFFYAGPYDTAYGTCGDAQQQWQLKGLGSAIDSGQVKVNLKGYAGTNGSPLITAHVDLYFRDSQNHSVARDGITRSVSGTNEAYAQTKGGAVLPAKTRILRLHLWADGDATVSSGDCQAFWDNLSVVLKRV